jgi:hypothetical protein
MKQHHSSNSMNNSMDHNRHVKRVPSAVQHPKSTTRNPLRRPVAGRRYQRRAFTARDGKRIVPFFEADFLLRKRFCLTEMIGSGGFGQIFRAIDKVRNLFFIITFNVFSFRRLVNILH